MNKSTFKHNPIPKKYPHLPDNYEEMTPKELLQLMVDEFKKAGDIARHNIQIYKNRQAKASQI